MKFGCAFFDVPEAPDSGGWASVGGNTAYRIRMPGDLANDVRWWTNIRYKKLYDLGFSSTKLKHSGYLRTEMAQIQEEIGMPVRRETRDKITSALSEIFSRVMRQAMELYCLPADKAGSGSFFHHELKPRLLPHGDKSVTQAIDAALLNAMVESSHCETKIHKTDRQIIVRPPRIEHAEDILSTPVPDEQWEWVNGEDIGPAASRAVTLANMNEPVLARVVVTRIDPHLSWIIGYGNGWGQGKDRHWLSHPELLWLSEFAEIQIEGAFIGGGYNVLQAAIPLQVGSVIDRLSISAGLLAENYWIAMATKSWSKGGYVTSPRAVWLRGTDRFALFCHAIRLHLDTGVRVNGYGAGGIFLVPRDGELEEVLIAARNNGLIYPIQVTQDAEPLGVVA